MRKTFLPFAPPPIGPEECREVLDTLNSGWISTGPKTRRFEAEFAAAVDSPCALALNSCTAGLHLALAVLGIGEGDEVITTPTTFCATANVVEHVRARPVLADIDPETLQLSPDRVRETITPRTRAIIPVHFAGHPCDMEPLLEIARQHGLAVVEDAAHALPAKYRGRTVGSIGDFTVFSFYATKNLTTGEGGMLTARDPDLLDRARVLSLHGMSRDAWNRYDARGSWFYAVTQPGFKYNMTDIQAALGLQQLRKLPAFQERRRSVAARYNSAFAAYPYFEVPACRPEVEHAWHLYVLRLNLETLAIDRDAFIRKLTELNIGTSVHFIPLHLHPYYRDRYGYHPDQFPAAYRTFTRSISLPLHPGLSDADVDDVVGAVVGVAETYRR